MKLFLASLALIMLLASLWVNAVEDNQKASLSFLHSSVCFLLSLVSRMNYREVKP